MSSSAKSKSKSNPKQQEQHKEEEQEQRGQQTVQLPPGWKASMDRRTQRRFYVNLVTKERTWYRPLRDDEPRDFYRKFDRKSGRIYYVNFHTKKTTWKLPPRAIVKDIRELKLASGSKDKNTARRAGKSKLQKSPSPVKRAFQDADQNGDGVIDEKEFSDLVRKARAQHLPSSSSSSAAAAASSSSSSSLPSSAASAPMSPSIHISRSGSIHIRSGASPMAFPDVPDVSFEGTENRASSSASAEDLNVRTTADYVRRMVEMQQEAERKAKASHDVGGKREEEEEEEEGQSRPLFATDHHHSQSDSTEQQHEEAARDEQKETERAGAGAYLAATEVKSGTSTLSAHAPDPSLATLHHDTESLGQDNLILRAQCADIRGELDRFRSGLNESLGEVSALLQTLGGIARRHAGNSRTSPRSLRYGARQARMAIENGPAPAEHKNREAVLGDESRSPMVHISKRGSITIHTN